MEYIILQDGRRVLVDDYITAKFMDLSESYNDLTRQEVKDQFEKIRNLGKLNVIGMFMKDEFKFINR
ncbi:MAG: hypothetical protein WC455_16785 [Dehalococcoidia bacterium]